MPQFDLFSYFSAATTLVLGFLLLVFVLYTYFRKISTKRLKFPKKILAKQSKQEEKTEMLLIVTKQYVNTMEKILKEQNKQ